MVFLVWKDTSGNIYFIYFFFGGGRGSGWKKAGLHKALWKTVSVPTILQLSVSSTSKLEGYRLIALSLCKKSKENRKQTVIQCLAYKIFAKMSNFTVLKISSHIRFFFFFFNLKIHNKIFIINVFLNNKTDLKKYIASYILQLQLPEFYSFLREWWLCVQLKMQQKRNLRFQDFIQS